MIIVIGGGAGGMISAIKAAESGKKVVLIEKNEKLGKKIYITGKGRCNVTNDSDFDDFLKQVNVNPKFLMSAINAFPPSALMKFFNNLGVQLKVERGGRVFPSRDKSSTILDALRKRLKDLNVEIRLNETVKYLKFQDDLVKYVVTNKSEIVADSVIIATGGITYPLTGSTGDGYKLAKSAGHSIVEPACGLVPIVLESVKDNKNNWVSILKNEIHPEGLSLKNVKAKVIEGKNLNTDKKPKFEEFGEMIFTNNGVSGPVILTLSSKITRLDFKELLFQIDLKPSTDLKTLDNRLVRDFLESSNKQFKNALDSLLPKSMIPAIISLSQIEPNKTVNSITKEERQSLAHLIKNLTYKIKGLESVERAIITTGGVSVKEIQPNSMRSKLIKNLYFAGEVIDVDAFTGGFNMQIAFSTGFLAGISAANQN